MWHPLEVFLFTNNVKNKYNKNLIEERGRGSLQYIMLVMVANIYSLPHYKQPGFHQRKQLAETAKPVILFYQALLAEIPLSFLPAFVV